MCSNSLTEDVLRTNSRRGAVARNGGHQIFGAEEVDILLSGDVVEVEEYVEVVVESLF